MCYGFYWRFLTEQGVSLCCRNKNKTSKKEIFSFEELTKKQIEERLQND